MINVIIHYTGWLKGVAELAPWFIFAEVDNQLAATPLERFETYIF
jgi:hypothetical protein